MTVFIEIPKHKVQQVEDFAKQHNLSLQELFLDSVLKRIDTESGVNSFANMLTKYSENDTEYSFEELDKDKKPKK